MSNRMGRVFSASRYAGALDAYIDYLKNMDRRGTRVGQGDPRPAIRALYLKPFGFDLGTTVRIHTSCSVPSWTALEEVVGARSRPTLTGTDTGIKMRGYKPPRIILKTGINPNGVPKTSARTRMKYLNYGGRSLSAPFGKVAATDVLVDEFETMKTALLGATQSPDRRVYLSPEFV